MRFLKGFEEIFVRGSGENLKMGSAKLMKKVRASAKILVFISKKTLDEKLKKSPELKKSRSW